VGGGVANDLCIAIAVSKPEDLDVVPGAIPSAKRVVAWAKSQGYDTALVTDENNDAVTCERLKKVFKNKLGQGGQRRLIVSFAGHGLIRGGAEEYWLLNGWRTQATEAVNHLKLRDRLGTYLPKQMAVISDACRSLPTARAKFVEGNGIVDVKDYVEKPLQVANLSGTRAAQPSYSAPIGVEEAQCFFTQVLMNALYGSPPDVVENDPILGKVVANDRLLSTVERELPLLANRYNRTQTPDLQGAWRSPENIWSVLNKFAAVDVRAFPAPGGPPPDRGSLEIGTLEREERAVTQVREFVSALRREERATHFETRTGLAVSGVAVTAVVVSPNFRTERDSPLWFRIYPNEGECSSVLARLENGDWVGAASYRDFIGTFGIGSGGAESYVLRRPYQDETGGEFAIAQAATGGALTDPYEMAAVLRDHKHDDPVLGALAAYAYARAGAVDEIRRMTYFYGANSQPAPFDAVLLARVQIKRDRFGYMASIPAVPRREWRTDAERHREWTFEATPAISVRVAGGFPWLRQGWALLEDDFRPEFRRLARFTSGLRPSVFTTLEPRAGEELASLVSKGDA
jgi:hypothetical protein